MSYKSSYRIFSFVGNFYSPTDLICISITIKIENDFKIYDNKLVSEVSCHTHKHTHTITFSQTY